MEKTILEMRKRKRRRLGRAGKVDMRISERGGKKYERYVTIVKRQRLG